MGKDKCGAERLQCSDCDCEEYEQPLNGHACGFCGCKPTKHKRAVAEENPPARQAQGNHTEKLRLDPDANTEFQKREVPGA